MKVSKTIYNLLQGFAGILGVWIGLQFFNQVNKIEGLIMIIIILAMTAWEFSIPANVEKMNIAKKFVIDTLLIMIPWFIFNMNSSNQSAAAIYLKYSKIFAILILLSAIFVIILAILGLKSLPGNEPNKETKPKKEHKQRQPREKKPKKDRKSRKTKNNKQEQSQLDSNQDSGDYL